MIRKILAGAVALGFAAVASAAVCPGPDTFGHTCQNEPTGCGVISAGNATGITGDDNCGVRPIGFSFNFYGTAYTQVGVATNGYLVMGSCTGGFDFTNDCPIPNTFTPNAGVYAAWDDFNVFSGSITDGLSGTAPNRIYTVSWNNVPYFSGAGTGTFSAQLHENGGAGERVVITTTSITQNNGYTSGIENATGTDGLTRYCNSGTAGSSCTVYARAAAPPTTSCDLTPVLNALRAVETKLDDDIPDALAQLSAEVGALQSSLCEIIRLLHVPQGNRTHSSVECGDFAWNGPTTEQ